MFAKQRRGIIDLATDRAGRNVPIRRIMGGRTLPQLLAGLAVAPRATTERGRMGPAQDHLSSKLNEEKIRGVSLCQTIHF